MSLRGTIVVLLIVLPLVACNPVVPIINESISDTNQAVPAEVAQSGSSLTPARVVSVIDGDTIRVEIDGRIHKLRYIGIDAPEVANGDRRGEWLGHEASRWNQDLVQGKTVLLEKDVSETDRYGRLLRYVWVGDTMINAELVRLGYARAVPYPPDVKHQDVLTHQQDEAKAFGRGLWSAPMD